MNILIAPDSFKGSLSAKEVCLAIEKGVKKIDPSAKITSIPLADGGEGTAGIITEQLKGTIITRKTSDPLGKSVKASFGILPDNTAIIDMAAASGLTRLKDTEKDPKVTSTYGTGVLIKKALDLGVSKIIIGLGGSATNDGGTGMASALGYRFLDKQGAEITLGGIYLSELFMIDASNKDPRIDNTEFIIATDVTNPLLGKDGASYTFAPQKGASKEDLKKLDMALEVLANTIEKDLGKDIRKLKGGGAAGGMGAGCSAFLNGKIVHGFDLIAKYTRLEEAVKKADLIITGEGLYDATSMKGKVISGVLGLAKQHGKQTIIIAGNSTVTTERHFPVYTLVNESINTEYAIEHAKKLIKKRAEAIFSVVLPELNLKK